MKERYPAQLSGGERQRVGVARAMAAEPPLMLMDEPFGAVDPIARDRLQNEFLRLQQEVRKTVVFVTHDLDEAVLLADRVVIMREGRVQEIMNVPLPRPRGDLGAIRGAAAFAETRYRIWQALHASAETRH